MEIVPLTDAHNRTIRDLRISLTDRCNFRCFYCLPHGEPAWASRETLLTFEELERLVSIFVDLGIEKIRLTGGEPLIRRDVPVLVEKFARLKPRLKDIALTTNGYDFPRHADALRDAGLDRVTLSLDTLDRQKFINITGVDALERVYAAIDKAKALGLAATTMNSSISPDLPANTPSHSALSNTCRSTAAANGRAMRWSQAARYATRSMRPFRWN